MNLKFSFLLLLLILIGCESDDSEYELVTVAVPQVVSKAELRKQVAVKVPEPTGETGKFYFYQDYIFVNEIKKGIHIIDNSNPEAPKKTAFINIPGNIDMAVKDDILYADSFTDLLTFDLTDMQTIKLVDELNNVLSSDSYPWPEITQHIGAYDFDDYDFDDDVIVGWEYRTEVRKKIVHDILMFDALNATYSRAEVAQVGTGGSMARFKIVGELLYALDTYKINVFQIERQVKKINEAPVYAPIETIFNEGDYLYIGSSDGMYIYSIVNPELPQYVSQINHVFGCDPVVVAGDYAYLTLRGGNRCGQDLSMLEVIDVSDKANPTVVDIYDMEGPYGLGIRGNLLYVSDGEHGLHIYDKQDPEDLKLLKIKTDLNIFDVIPLQKSLLTIGDNRLRQFKYLESDLELISDFQL
ncbi:MAG: hypothetical protein WBG71_00185 [Leeuwenhoekiella sp.]